MRINVTSQDSDLKATASKLRKLGMKVDSVLDSIGVISGEIAEGKLSALQKTPGITFERDKEVQLPPPDAPVQ